MKLGRKKKYPKFVYIRHILTEKRIEIYEKNMPNSLYDAGAKLEFIMENIADKPRLI